MKEHEEQLAPEALVIMELSLMFVRPTSFRDSAISLNQIYFGPSFCCRQTKTLIIRRILVLVNSQHGG